MHLRKIVSRTLVTFVALGLFSVSALSQTRPRILHPISDKDEISSSSEGFTLAVNVRETKPVWEAKPRPTIDLSTTTGPANSAFLKYEPLLLSAIEERLGPPYRWGATGPDRFDCSGFG